MKQHYNLQDKVRMIGKTWKVTATPNVLWHQLGIERMD